jgi:hypothetical protein
MNMNGRVIAAATLLWCLTSAADAVGRLVEVEIYDRAERRPLPVYRHEGRHYVVGRPGNEYRIRVRNRTGADVLAVVSVDGVNAVNGETADWSQTGYVIGAREAYDVVGWRKSLQRVAAFFFTRHENSYAARTGRPHNVGVVGVALFRRKEEPAARIDRSPPRAEPPAADDIPYPAGADSAGGSGAGARSAEGAAEMPDAPLLRSPQRAPGLGTGHGRSVTSRAGYTRFERATAEPEEIVAIHYDTYRNLVALGVIRAPRVATPFPGQFVPDPQ